MELTALLLSGGDTPAGRVLVDGYRRLRFADQRLEREFRRVLRRQHIRVLTVSLAAAMLAVAWLGWLEWQSLPQATATWTLLIRVVLMLALPAAALVAAYSRRLHDDLGLFVLLALLGLGAGSIAVHAIAHAAGEPAGYPGVAVVVLFGYLFLGLRLRQSLLLNLLLSAAQLLVIWSIEAPPTVLRESALLLVIANLLGAAGGYLLEYGWRTDYLKTLVINYLAERDGLTGVYNRRMFDHYIERIWRESIRDKALLVMMLVDVDAFREFNERYGLAAGDETLQRIAEAITRAARRPLDFVARYSGLGFAIVLFNPDRAYGQELPERLRGEVGALAIPHAGSPCGRTLTVSIGLAVTVPSERQLLKDFIGLAENALAQAKSRGRNCVVAMESRDSLAVTGMFDAELLSPGQR